MSDQAGSRPGAPTPGDAEDSGSPAEAAPEVITPTDGEQAGGLPPAGEAGPQAPVSPPAEASPGEPPEGASSAEEGGEPVPVEPATLEAPVDDRHEPEPEPEPVEPAALEAPVDDGHEPEPAPAAGEDAGPEPPPAPGERVEWQPVAGDDQLEWQPVAVPEASEDVDAPEPEPPWFEEAEEGSDPRATAWTPEVGFDDPDSIETDWDATALIEPTSPVAGNGAAGGREAPSERRRSSAPSGREGRVPPAPAPSDPSRVKRQVVLLSVLTLLVVTIGVVAFILSRGAKENADQATTAPPSGGSPASSVPPTLPESALQTFRDEATGFTVKYARNWERLVPPVADIRLLLNAGGNDGFQVRVRPIQVPATVDNIGNFKAVTDEVVFGDKSAKLIQEQLVTVNGLLAYYYLYEFTDPVTKQQGIHAHYFIFEGKRMFMLQFQSVPIEDFPRQAGFWDQVAESFVVQAPPTTTTPTTTAAPPTTSG